MVTGFERRGESKFSAAHVDLAEAFDDPVCWDCFALEVVVEPDLAIDVAAGRVGAPLPSPVQSESVAQVNTAVFVVQPIPSMAVRPPTISPQCRTLTPIERSVSRVYSPM